MAILPRIVVEFVQLQTAEGRVVRVLRAFGSRRNRILASQRSRRRGHLFLKWGLSGTSVCRKKPAGAPVGLAIPVLPPNGKDNRL